ncbi:sulfurtransferase [Aquibacillus sp. 3ASR75-11]|uniref:Sulfurtransferase n=1 Tax=Terrihalobacillus insolitus TaxID=2950438 RepID=A0A9X3WQ99_9BACI|nr:sulfurtransferase [Terrihalobacillus insolitus]MDC3412693.1 sulfurtransferase [Terrihalobacillus insolitus]MDC3423830.1 sulfurtransferase [Terrihalobacillus insolitus]
MFLLISGLLVAFLYLLYQRYFPVYRVKCVDIERETIHDDITLLDIRDFNVADRMPVSNAINLPQAHLNRYYKKIKSQEVIVIVPDLLSLNFSVRYLRKKGFKVIGYYMIETGKEFSLERCGCSH